MADKRIVLRGVSRPEHVERFEFDPGSGQFLRTQHIDYGVAAAGARGFGGVREVGLIQRERVFVAVYSLNGALHVDIPPQRFSWPGPFVVKRRSVFGRIKKFSVGVGSRRHLQFYYRFIDSVHGFPGPDVMDLFYMIARETSSGERIRGFIHFWEAHAAGVDVMSSEFQRELAEVSRGV